MSDNQKTLQCKVSKALDPFAMQKEHGGPPPYVGPKGGLWADPLHTIHWTAPKQAAEAETPFYLRGRHTQVGRQGVEEPVELPKVKQAKMNTHGGSKLKLDGIEAPQARHSSVDIEGLEGAPKGGGLSSIGDAESWFQDFGFDDNPGWGGEWKSTAEADPNRYNLEGAQNAEEQAFRLRNMRMAEKFPEEILKIATGTLLMSEVPYIGLNGRSSRQENYDLIKDWASSEDRNEEDLNAMLKNEAARIKKQLKSPAGKSILDVLSKGVHKFPDHGPSLRRWLRKQPEMKHFSTDALSYALRIMGYTDISSLGPRLVAEMTGAGADAVEKISRKLADSPKLYLKFEEKMEDTESFKEEDPKGIRLPMAEWRMWSVLGDDEIQEAFWGSIGSLAGMKDVSKAIEDEEVDLIPMLSSAFAFTYHNLGPSSPIIYDAIPILSTLYGRDVEVKKSWFVIRLDLSKGQG